MKQVEAIIFDWAGTVIDYGCFAPLQVFCNIFADRGVELTLAEAREPMGMLKIDHIRTITEMPRVRAAWTAVHGTEPTESDVVSLYEQFEVELFAILADYTDPIDGVLPVIAELRQRGYKIGSTTGYTRAMMDIVTKGAAAKGYTPDFVATADDVVAGRPYPWMAYYNAMHLGVYPMSRLVKVGDTTVDMEEGRNAGMWTVGVILGSSTLGLSEAEVSALSEVELQARMAEAEATLRQAGAHYVIPTMAQLFDVLAEIEQGVAVR